MHKATSTSASSQVGHVYVLVSPKCEYIKIGGTDFAPLKRIKEINSVEPYKQLGPWSLHDFRQVRNWRKVENALHYAFRSKLVKSVAAQKELFELSPIIASTHLEQIDESALVMKPKVDRMFQDFEFSKFLAQLFRFTGILNWLDFQGAWTFTLFPSTVGGRYYTINIGAHEVAFAAVRRIGARAVHMVHMDRLIHDFEPVVAWLVRRNGGLVDGAYSRSLQRSTSAHFEGTFQDALEFMSLDGVRRAVIAYWTEALINLQESGRMSSFSRFHNWNAVAELRRRILSKSL